MSPHLRRCTVRAILVGSILTAGCTTKPENKPPTAALSVAPERGVLEDTYALDAGGTTDDEDESRYIQVRWDVDGDGTWDTRYGNVKTRSMTFPTRGQKHVRIEARDTGGLTDTAEITLQVGSVPVAALTVTPAVGTVDSTYTFDASGTSDAGFLLSELEFRWDWDGDSTWDTEWAVGAVVTHQFSVANDYTTWMQVRNDFAEMDSASVGLEVYPTGSQPTAAFTVTPDSGYVETEFEFDAGISSDQQDLVSDLQVRWDWQTDGVWDTPWSTTKTVLHTFPFPAEYSVGLQVQDSAGFLGSTSHAVVVLNRLPTALFTVQPDSGTVATDFQFDASSSSDPDELIAYVQVRWDWESDGGWDTPWDYLKRITHNFPTIGGHEVTLQVLDSSGATDSTRVNVRVYNTPPSVSITSTTDYATIGDASSFTASPSDLEDADSTLQIRWDFDDDGSYEIDWSTADRSVAFTYPAIGSYTVRTEVMDSGGVVRSTTVPSIVGPDAAWIYDPTVSTTFAASPAVDPSSGVIVIGDMDGVLHAVNPDGSEAWTAGGFGAIRPAAVIADDGTIYFGSDDAGMHAVNSGGSDAWVYHTQNIVDSSPALDTSGNLYFLSNDDTLYAVDPTGERNWGAHVGHGDGSSVAIRPDDVILAPVTGSFGVFAYDLSGAHLWDFHFGWAHIYATPAVGADTTAVLLMGTFFTRFKSPSDRHGIGPYDRGGLARAPIIRADGYYLMPYYGTLRIWSPGVDGSQVGSYEEITSDLEGSPLVAQDGSVFAVTVDNFLVKWNPDTTVAWKYYFGGGSTRASPSIGADGNIYVAAADGRLHAVAGGAGPLQSAPWPKFRGNLQNSGRITP